MKVYEIINIDNIDFTFFSKNQNNEGLESSSIPFNAKSGVNQEINNVFEDPDLRKKEPTDDEIKINKPLNNIPETEINEFNEMGIEKIVSQRKSKELVNLIEKENTNLNVKSGTELPNKTTFPSSKFTFHNESSIIQSKTIFSQENTFSEVKKEKIEMQKKVL